MSKAAIHVAIDIHGHVSRVKIIPTISYAVYL